MSEEIRKVVRDGKVAVLVSPGYGAGWSTWGGPKQVLFSPEIVALVERGASGYEIAEVAHRLFGEGFFCGGADQLVVDWVPVGTRFRIDEYDGAEALEVFNDDSYEVA